jgi:hypothetical protein
MLNALDSITSPLIVLNVLALGGIALVALGTRGGGAGRAANEARFKSAMSSTSAVYAPPPINPKAAPGADDVVQNAFDEGKRKQATHPGVTPASPGVVPASPGVVPASPGVVPASPGVVPASPGVVPASPGNAAAVVTPAQLEDLKSKFQSFSTPFGIFTAELNKSTHLPIRGTIKQVGGDETNDLTARTHRYILQERFQLACLIGDGTCRSDVPDVMRILKEIEKYVIVQQKKPFINAVFIKDTTVTNVDGVDNPTYVLADIVSPTPDGVTNVDASVFFNTTTNELLGFKPPMKDDDGDDLDGTARLYPPLPDELARMYPSGGGKLSKFEHYMHHLMHLDMYCKVPDIGREPMLVSSTLTLDDDQRVAFIGDLEGRSHSLYQLLDGAGIATYDDGELTWKDDNQYVIQMGDQFDSCRWAAGDFLENPEKPEKRPEDEAAAKRWDTKCAGDVNMVFFTDYIDYISGGKMINVYGNHEQFNVKYAYDRTRERVDTSVQCHTTTGNYVYTYTAYAPAHNVEYTRIELVELLRKYVMPRRTIAHIVKNEASSARVLVSHAGIYRATVDSLSTPPPDTVDAVVQSLNEIKKQYLNDPGKEHPSMGIGQESVIWSRQINNAYEGKCDEVMDYDKDDKELGLKTCKDAAPASPASPASAASATTGGNSMMECDIGLQTWGGESVIAQFTGHNSLNYENHGFKDDKGRAVSQNMVVINEFGADGKCKPFNKTRLTESPDDTASNIPMLKDKYYMVMTDALRGGAEYPDIHFVNMVLVGDGAAAGSLFRRTLPFDEQYKIPPWSESDPIKFGRYSDP